MDSRVASNQRGISLVSLIFILAILGMLGLVALRVAPTVTEFMTVKKIIVKLKESGTSIPQMRMSFNQQADIGYVDAINGKDLDIVQGPTGFEISFAYQKKIPLAGPVSLVIDYEGSTSATKLPKPAASEQ